MVMHGILCMPYGIRNISYDGKVSSGICHSLKEICFNKLVSNYSLIPKDAFDLPPELMQPLLLAAVTMNQKESIKSILKIWPNDSLKFEIPRDLKTWKLVARRKNSSSFMEKILRLHDCMELISAGYVALGCLDCADPNIVRYLDLTELPVLPHLVRSLCFKIPRRQFDTDFSAQLIHQVVMKVYCIIDSCDKADLLSLTLKELENSGKRKCVSITGLCISDGGYNDYDEPLIHLLDLLDPDGFDTFICSAIFGCVPFRFTSLGILRALRKFTQLQTLDMSLSAFDFRIHDDYFIEFKELLRELTQLKELNLSACFISGSLEFLFGRYNTINAFPAFNSSRKLEYLAFAYCELTSEDINFLAQSPHARNLKHLDLRYSDLDVIIFGTLLTACKNLCILDLEFCSFYNGSSHDLFKVLSTMQKLCFLDVSDTTVTSCDLLTNVKYISEMSSLECIKISYVVPMRAHFLRRRKYFLSKFKYSINKLRNPTLMPVDVMCL